MGQRLRRLARAIGRLTLSGKMLIALVLLVIALYGVGTFEGTILDNPLVMYVSMSLAIFLLALMGVVLFVRSDLRLPQWSVLNSGQMIPWYVGFSPIAIAALSFPLTSFPLFFPTTSLGFRTFWSLRIDGVVLALAVVLMLTIWIRRQWLARLSAAGGVAISQPNATPPHVSRRTLLVGGVVVALELAGVGWFVSKLPALIPQRTFKLAVTFQLFPLIAWAPDGRRLVGLGDDGALTVWDATTGATLQKLPISADNLYGYAWSPDGSEIAIGAASNVLGALAQIQMWDVVHQRISQTYLDSYAQRDDTPTLVWRGSAVGFVSDTIENSVDTVYFWDAQANTNRKLLTASNLPGLRVFSPDGRYLAALTELGGGVETPVYVWDTQTGELVITHIIVKRDTIDFMQALAWSPDGRRLAIGASFNRAIVFDALTGAHWQTLQGPLDLFNHFADELRIHSLAWSPDSRSLAVASDDTTVRIWRDEPEGKPATVFVWAGHMDNVYVVAWSPTGQSIASVDLYGVVQIWRPQGDLWGA